MEKAVVCGYGVIGKATALSLGITSYYSRSEKNVELKELGAFDYIFICLPTPVTELGFYNTKIIEEVLDEVFRGNFKSPIIVIRSTVYPGFTRYIQKKYDYNKFVFNPEFLTEATAENDALFPEMVVIGGDDAASRDKVAGIYNSRFKHSKVFVTNSQTAEMVKVSLNGFFATKVIFANEIYNYCQKAGANYNQVKDILEIHKWGPKNHFEIYHQGGRGAGGKCLNKDLKALSHYSESSFLREADKINQELLAKSKK